jgi:hypothetical protein
VLKLNIGGSGKVDNTKPFIDEVMSMTQKTPFGNYFDMGNGIVVFKLEKNNLKDNSVWLKDLVADPPKEGLGSKFLEQLTELADKHQINLDLTPHPLGTRNKIPKPKLVGLYEKFGFKKNGQYMTREAKQSDDNIQRLADEIKVDISKFDPEELKMGFQVEKEHMKDADINVINKESDILKIALAHLRENPKYYTLLKKVEK